MTKEDMRAHHEIGGMIENALRQKIEKIIKEEVENTKSIVVSQVRESVGEIAASVLQYFEMERMGSRLVITVQLPTEEKK